MSTRESLSDESVINNLEEEIIAMDICSNKVINILLFGETGVGKSTFINAFTNYLHYSSLKTAMRNDLITIIPTKFTTMDDNFEEKIIELKGDDDGNALETQCCKSYLFPIRQGDLKICFIDTPGITDTRGINYITNFENILSFISDKHLNAICVLLKPNVSRLTVELEYCIRQLLSRLDKSACNNLVFVFTNTRSTFYRPGETLPTVRKLFETITNVSIPLSKDNMFCMDNECFRFLAESKNNIHFDSKSIEGFSKSWKKSSREFCRMIQYIAGGGPNNNTPLEPYLVDNIISINKSRHLVLQLSKPLADITQLIQDNILLLQKHIDSLVSSSNNLTELKSKLNMPVIDLNVTTLDKPTTVCTSPGCCLEYVVNNEIKWHYKQRCHDPCFLADVPKEIIGTEELKNCAAMGAKHICNHCNCSYQQHMHIYYDTKIFQTEIVDSDVQKKIDEEEMATTIAQDLIDKTKCRLEEYRKERNIILKTAARFAYFLQENAETTYNDAYRSYLLFLIQREKCMDDLANPEIILKYTNILEQYEEEKQILGNAFKQSEHETSTVTANNIMYDVSVLYNLKHSGDKIQQLIAYKNDIPKKEFTSENNEYIYEPRRNERSNSTSSYQTSYVGSDGQNVDDADQGQTKSKNCNNHETTNTVPSSNVDDADHSQTKSENCNNHESTKTVLHLSFCIPNNCQHAHNQGCSTGGIHENAFPFEKNICFNFNFYNNVPQCCVSEKKACP